MRCRICQADNPPNQVRCRRCQCRLAEAAAGHDDGPFYVHGAAAPDPAQGAAPSAEPRFTVTRGGGVARNRPVVQPPLFPASSKLVDFEEYLPADQPRRRNTAPRRTRPSPARELPGQISFDFDAPPLAGRGLDASSARLRVAGLARRSFSCLVDLALAAAVGVLPFFLVVRAALAASWPADSRIYAALAAACWIIVALYHLLFAVAGAPSFGQRLARLRLVTLEGRPGEPRIASGGSCSTRCSLRPACSEACGRCSPKKNTPGPTSCPALSSQRRRPGAEPSGGPGEKGRLTGNNTLASDLKI